MSRDYVATNQQNSVTVNGFGVAWAWVNLTSVQFGKPSDPPSSRNKRTDHHTSKAGTTLAARVSTMIGNRAANITGHGHSTRKPPPCDTTDTQDLRAYWNESFQDRDRVIDASCRLVGNGDIVARCQRVGVFHTEDAGAVVEEGLVCRDRLGQTSDRQVGERHIVTSDQRVGLVGTQLRRFVDVGEIVAGGECIGMVGAQNPLWVDEDSLELCHRIIEATRRVVGAGEVVP